MIYVSRRKIIWKNVRDFKSVLAFWIATASGAGLFPRAPGTMGSLVGIPVAYFTQSWELPLRIAFWVVLTFVGTWSAKVFDGLMDTHDNQNIVIDEVIGMGITGWTAGNDPKTWIAAFLLFRFFDVLKPPPVRSVDQWSHKQASPWLGGFGVIADDMIAGAQGLVIVLLLQFFELLK